MPDHVHFLVSLGKTISISELLKEMKIESSKWMKQQGVRGFSWQDGYGAFSIGESQRLTLERYIRNQAKHHARMTFAEELEALLKRHQVAYDPRYLLG
jgi:REP element-mobilizing transposase RayT